MYGCQKHGLAWSTCRGDGQAETASFLTRGRYPFPTVEVFFFPYLEVIEEPFQRWGAG